jgi:hypothetical protein
VSTYGSEGALAGNRQGHPAPRAQRSAKRDAGVDGERDDGLDALLADPLGRDQLGEVPGVAVRGIGGRGEQGGAAPARCRLRLPSFLSLELVGLPFWRLRQGVEPV